MTPIALTIAGSDSGGGAGIQADLKTFSALGVYGASVLTALTAQNTLGVSAIHDVPTDFVRAQIDAVFSDITINAIKIGMLSQPDIIETVAKGLIAHGAGAVVLDPVMVAESGDPLLAQDAVTSLVEHLFPLAAIITPNLHEAARLLKAPAANSKPQMENQAAALIDLGARAVLLKGGHANTDEAADFLLTADGQAAWFSAPFVKTRNTHGTGCSLSSAIAAGMAKGLEIESAVETAKQWLFGAIAHADELGVGQGAGPVHHFYKVWKASK